jgi:hypothetical protein
MGIGNQKDKSLNRSVTIIAEPNEIPRLAKKKLILLSKRMRAPGKKGSREMILVLTRPSRITIGLTEIPKPQNNAYRVNPSDPTTSN